MSQRTFRCGPYEVLTGWDRPLRYHFLVIEQGGEPVYSNLTRKNPAMTVDEIAYCLHSFTIAPPPTLLDDLGEDRLNNAGNLVCRYEPTEPLE